MFQKVWFWFWFKFFVNSIFDDWDIIRYKLHTTYFLSIVRSRWCFQGWIKRIPQTRTCWRWLQWCGSPCYSLEDWNYHPCHQNPKCLRRERTTYQRVNFCCSKKIQFPWRQRWGRLTYIAYYHSNDILQTVMKHLTSQ